MSQRADGFIARGVFLSEKPLTSRSSDRPRPAVIALYNTFRSYCESGLVHWRGAAEAERGDGLPPAARGFVRNVRHCTLAPGTGRCSFGHCRSFGLRLLSRFGVGERTIWNGIQHNNWNLALSLALVIGVRRPELNCLLPQPCALLAGCSPGSRLHRFVPTCTSASGLARRLRYQPGCSGAPPFEATTK